MGRKNEFLWRRNLEGEVMLELQRVDFILFYFQFIFNFQT